MSAKYKMIKVYCLVASQFNLPTLKISRTTTGSEFYVVCQLQLLAAA